MFLFGRERNEAVIVNQAKSFPSNYTNRVGHLLTALLQSIVNTCNLYFWSCFYCKQPLLWPLLRKKILYHCVLSLNFTRVFKGLKSCIFKKIEYLMNIATFFVR